MRRVAGDQREREPRALAAPQFAALGDRLVAGEAEAPQLRAHRARRLARHHARHLAQWRVPAVQFLDMLLGVIADPHLARRPPRTVTPRNRQSRDYGKRVVVLEEIMVTR